jgi:hypothetical protein
MLVLLYYILIVVALIVVTKDGTVVLCSWSVAFTGPTQLAGTDTLHPVIPVPLIMCLLNNLYKI